jgi:hypothetical protein
MVATQAWVAGSAIGLCPSAAGVSLRVIATLNLREICAKILYRSTQ